MKEQIIIRKNIKVKLVGLFILFVILAGVFWFIQNHVSELPNVLLGLKLTAIVILIGLPIFGIVITYKLLKNPIALKIDNEGLTDTSNIESVGFIPWYDIESFELIKAAMGRRIIVVHLKKPNDYIYAKAKMQNVRHSNYKNHSSPVLILGVNINYNVEELVETLQEKLKNLG